MYRFFQPLLLLAKSTDSERARLVAYLEAEGVGLQRVGPSAPNSNADAERFVQSIEVECLDHSFDFGKGHLLQLVPSYAEQYDAEAAEH